MEKMKILYLVTKRSKGKKKNQFVFIILNFHLFISLAYNKKGNFINYWENRRKETIEFYILHIFEWWEENFCLFAKKIEKGRKEDFLFLSLFSSCFFLSFLKLTFCNTLILSRELNKIKFKKNNMLYILGYFDL